MKEALYLDYRRAPAHAWTGKLLLWAGLLALAAAGLGYRHLSSLEASQRARLAEIASGDLPMASQPRADPQQQAEIQHAGEVSLHLALPWETLFQSLEASGDGDVAILGIESQASPSKVRITAEARDFAAMVHYVERLQAIHFFTQVELLTHHLRTEDPQHPVRFEISALWGTSS